MERKHIGGGRIPNQNTCQNNSKTKPTRIDVILANPQALTLIYDFEVQKVDGFPTHSIIRIKLIRSAMRQERYFARNMPSLKKIFEDKMEAMTKDDDAKTKAATIRAEKEKLHDAMDAMFGKAQDELRYHAKRKDTTKLWKAWSKAVENGWIDYLGLGKELAKKNRGRGEATIVKKIPGKNKDDNGVNYNEWTRKSIISLKNARRCEQMAYRIEMINNKTSDKIETLERLNAEAFKGIQKHMTGNVGKKQTMVKS